MIFGVIMSGVQNIEVQDKNSNKNIWLAIALAVITSVTSLGTALITSKSNAPVNNEEVVELKDRIEVLDKKFTKFSGFVEVKFVNTKSQSVREARKIFLEELKEKEEKWDYALSRIGNEVKKNTKRSIACYSSLTPQEMKKGSFILKIINAEEVNKSSKMMSSTSGANLSYTSHLNKDLLITNKKK